MHIRVGIENNNDGRSIAWALEHPGLYAYGADAQQAAANMPTAVNDYAGWVRQHGTSWMDHAPFEIDLEQTFDAYFVSMEEARARHHEKPYMIESFFAYDGQALSGDEVKRALKMLEWSRRDLLDSIQGLTPSQLGHHLPDERWSINGILQHIAGAEWWYQACLGVRFPDREEDLPKDPLQSLELVRTHFLAFLPKQTGVSLALDVEGEIWSPRKVLRRALWHERDHTGHIRKLLPQLPPAGRA